MKKILMIIMCASMALAVMAGVPPVGRAQMNAPASAPVIPGADLEYVRVTTLEAFSVSWDDSTNTYVVDNTPQEMGWKTCWKTDETTGHEVLEGFYGDFNIPVSFDDNGMVYFYTGMCLDAYEKSADAGRYRYDTISYIYAVPEVWLLDENEESWEPICGTINEDGTAHFDGGFAYMIEIVANKTTINSSSLISTDTTWLLTPVFRNINVRKPNGVHSYKLMRNNFPHDVTTNDVLGSFVQRGLGLVPRPIRPGHGKPDTGEEPSMLFSGLHADHVVFVVGKDELPIGPNGLVPRPIRPGKPEVEGIIKGSIAPSNGNIDLANTPIRPNDNNVLRKEDVDKRRIDINGLVPRGPGKPKNPDRMGDLSDSSTGDVALTQSQMPNGVSIIDRLRKELPWNTDEGMGLVPRPIKPGKPRDGYIVSPSLAQKIHGVDYPTDGSNINAVPDIFVDMEEPVYICQSPEDNSIRVYNLFGNGFVCNVFDFQEDNSLMLPAQMIGFDYGSNQPIFNCGLDSNSTVELGNVCEITADQISWGSTIPYVIDAQLDYYYLPSTINLFEGSQFVIPIFIPGDVDGDGSLNISDLTALIDRLMTSATQGEGIPANIGAADVNQDQSLNIADVTALIDMMLGNN